MIDRDLAHDLELRPDDELLWASRATGFNISLPVFILAAAYYGGLQLASYNMDFSESAEGIISLFSLCFFAVMAIFIFLPMAQKHYITRRYVIVRVFGLDAVMSRKSATIRRNYFMGRRYIMATEPKKNGSGFYYMGLYGVTNPELFLEVVRSGKPIYSV